MYIMQTKQPKKDIRRWDEMLFGDLFEDFFPKHPIGTMKTDIKEYPEKYALEVEIPGYSKKDISISLEDGYLTISATKKSEEVVDGKVLRKERFVGTTSRSYYVGEVDKNKIQASYVDGVLMVELPKEEKKEEERKIIEIK